MPVLSLGHYHLPLFPEAWSLSHLPLPDLSRRLILGDTPSVTPDHVIYLPRGPITGDSLRRRLTVAKPFSIWQIRSGRVRTRVIRNGCRNTQQHSSAIFVRNASRAHTTCGLIFAPIQMKDRLSVLSAGKLLRASMIVNGMKGCIRARRNLSVEGTCRPGDNGAAVAGSLVPTL